METSIVNEKGQITIPAAIRKQMKLGAGSTLRLFLEPDHGTLVLSQTGSIKDAFGILPKPVKSVTVEDMDEAMKNSVAEDAMRDARD